VWNGAKKACMVMMNGDTTAKTVGSSCKDNNVIVAAEDFTCGLNLRNTV